MSKIFTTNREQMLTIEEEMERDQKTLVQIRKMMMVGIFHLFLIERLSRILEMEEFHKSGGVWLHFIQSVFFLGNISISFKPFYKFFENPYCEAGDSIHPSNWRKFRWILAVNLLPLVHLGRYSFLQFSGEENMAKKKREIIDQIGVFFCFILFYKKKFKKKNGSSWNAHVPRVFSSSSSLEAPSPWLRHLNDYGWWPIDGSDKVNNFLQSQSSAVAWILWLYNGNLQEISLILQCRFVYLFH